MWEADQSNAEWYTALGNALEKVVASMKQPELYIGLFPGTELIGQLHQTLTLLDIFWERLRNKDDLALTRAIAFGRADLKAIYDHPLKDADWRFDARSKGMGDFTLTVHYAGTDPNRSSRPERPEDTQLYVTSSVDGTTWYTDTPLPPGTTRLTPGLAALDGKLYCVIVPESGVGLEYSSFDGSNWSSFAPFTTGEKPATGSPALAAFNGKLYCLTRDSSDGSLQLATFDGSTWTPFTQFAGPRQTDRAPALAVYDGKLYCAVKDTGSMYMKCASFDGHRWTPLDIFYSQDALTDDAPALAAFDGKLHCVVSSGPVLNQGTFDGNSWSDFTRFETRADFSGTTALAVHRDKLHCAYRAYPEDYLWYDAFDGNRWSNRNRLGGLSAVSPALAVLDDKLYCVHRG
ncbi:hypothetical protein AB0D71_46240 [Streptomyces avermitilis]|uniref:hypothetical protein n=1 Tax=Streptomyces avermitilis TaxID=33903 RepID=UPI00340367BC